MSSGLDWFRGFAAGACLAAVSVAPAAPPAGMVLIPAGNYQPVLRAAGAPSSIPVPAFYLDVTAVTNADFLAFVRANPAWRRSAAAPLFAEHNYLGDWKSDSEPGLGSPGGSPVVLVSWFAAAAYSRWRHRRLPTTAEWERAAGAGFTAVIGSDDPAYRAAALRWLAEPAVENLPAAGLGRANYYGARGMVGSVWEWVDDFNSTPGGGSSVSGGEPDGSLFCGGAGAGAQTFSDYPAFARVQFRSSLRANYVIPNLGFRCALTP